jgi:hypothetical protein
VGIGSSLADDAGVFRPEQKPSVELYADLSSELLNVIKMMDACLSYLEKTKAEPSMVGVCSVFGEMKKRKEHMDQMSKTADRTLAYERKRGFLSPRDAQRIRNLQYELSERYSEIADRIERLLSLDAAYKASRP